MLAEADDAAAAGADGGAAFGTPPWAARLQAQLDADARRMSELQAQVQAGGLASDVARLEPSLGRSPTRPARSAPPHRDAAPAGRAVAFDPAALPQPLPQPGEGEGGGLLQDLQQLQHGCAAPQTLIPRPRALLPPSLLNTASAASVLPGTRRRAAPTPRCSR